MKRAGIYMGWVGRDNLGDEAMYALCRERFPFVRWSSESRVAYEPNAVRFLRQGLGNTSHLVRSVLEELRHQPRLRKLATRGIHGLTAGFRGEVGILGGGTLLNQAASNLESYIEVRKRTRSLVPVFGTGVACPEFWSPRPEWKDLRKEWVSVLAELPIVGVRGPYSKDLLTDAGATNVVACGDPGILFHRQYSQAPMEDGSKVQREERRDRPLRVAINTGDCYGKLWGQPEGIQEALLALTQWLTQAKHQVEFLPVSSRDVPSCRDLARLAGLPEASVSPALVSHDAFLEKVAGFEIVVALKLHAAILASAATVPCVVLEYQPKCLDFAASLEWERFTIRTGELSAANLIERVEALIAELPATRKTLHNNAERLCQRFEEYCQAIEPLVAGKARLLSCG